MHRSHISRPIRRAQGMSLIEMCVVISIMLIVAMMVTPRVVSVMAETRLRGSASEVASLLQQARMRAVRSNTFVTVRYLSLPGNVPGGPGNFAYADTWGGGAPDGSGNGAYDGNAAPAGNREALVTLGNSIRFVQAANPVFTPTKVDTVAVIQNDAPLRITWSARGLPCQPAGNICQVAVAYAYFLTDGTPDLAGGRNTNRWAAVTVSRSGRIKVWMWTGADWQ